MAKRTAANLAIAEETLHRALVILECERDCLFECSQVDGRVPETDPDAIDRLVEMNEVIRDIQTVLWT